ncbi:MULTISPECIES: hypothetical protein [unclassified Rhizobium]|uniref:hypothetical protein n=1 Tax=unclassified Rhizobium TaxID=2613769 RepID=UPI0012E3E4FA|nr:MULTISPECIES: hypothetical protein [unclassified Rhizobium]
MKSPADCLGIEAIFTPDPSPSNFSASMSLGWDARFGSYCLRAPSLRFRDTDPNFAAFAHFALEKPIASPLPY